MFALIVKIVLLAALAGVVLYGIAAIIASERDFKKAQRNQTIRNAKSYLDTCEYIAKQKREKSTGMEQLEQIERTPDELYTVAAVYQSGDGTRTLFYPKDGGAPCVVRRHGNAVLIENAPLTKDARKKIDDFFAEQRKRVAPSLADTTDRETVEKIQAFVDDSISNPRKIEIVESGWRPLPMEELRKKVK